MSEHPYDQCKTCKFEASRWAGQDAILPCGVCTEDGNAMYYAPSGEALLRQAMEALIGVTDRLKRIQISGYAGHCNECGRSPYHASDCVIGVAQDTLTALRERLEERG